MASELSKPHKYIITNCRMYVRIIYMKPIQSSQDDSFIPNHSLNPTHLHHNSSKLRCITIAAQHHVKVHLRITLQTSVQIPFQNVLHATRHRNVNSLLQAKSKPSTEKLHSIL